MMPSINGYLKALTAKPIEDDKNGCSDVWADVATAEDAPPGGSCRCYWAPNQIRILSSIQLAVGILCIVFQVIGVILHSALTNSGHGIWAGILFIIAGSLGLVASKRKTQICILVHLVMCILDIAGCLCVIILSSGGLFYDRKLRSIQSLDSYHYSSKGSRMAADAILISLASMELGVTLWTIILCARVIFSRYKRGGIFIPYHVQYVAPNLLPPASQSSRIVSQSTVYPVSSIVPLLCEEEDNRQQTNN